MAHEHILLWYGPPPPTPPPPPPALPPPLQLRDVELQTSRVNDYANAGGSALISMSSYGLRWDAPGAPPVLPFAPLTFVKAIQKVSTNSGAAIILGTGYYMQPWQSSATQALPITALCQTIINDIFNGNDGVHSGIIGEIGMDAPTVPTLVLFEWKSLVAACHAVIATGLAMNVHTEIGMPGQMRMLILDICEQP